MRPSLNRAGLLLKSAGMIARSFSIAATMYYAMKFLLTNGQINTSINIDAIVIVLVTCPYELLYRSNKVGTSNKTARLTENLSGDEDECAPLLAETFHQDRRNSLSTPSDSPENTNLWVYRFAKCLSRLSHAYLPFFFFSSLLAPERFIFDISRQFILSVGLALIMSALACVSLFTTRLEQIMLYVADLPTHSKALWEQNRCKASIFYVAAVLSILGASTRNFFNLSNACYRVEEILITQGILPKKEHTYLPIIATILGIFSGVLSISTSISATSVMLKAVGPSGEKIWQAHESLKAKLATPTVFLLMLPNTGSSLFFTYLSSKTFFGACGLESFKKNPLEFNIESPLAFFFTTLSTLLALSATLCYITYSFRPALRELTYGVFRVTPSTTKFSINGLVSP